MPEEHCTAVHGHSELSGMLEREEDKRERDREIREGQTESVVYGKREGVGERETEGDMK